MFGVGSDIVTGAGVTLQEPGAGRQQCQCLGFALGIRRTSSG